jgi:pimeloyl-ACP methyl ester carboxylesterase
MQLFKLCVVLSGCLFLSACLRLDANLYNPSTEIKSYQRDAYTGEQDFVLDATYKIPDSLIKVFTLNSSAQGETTPTPIYATYIGSVSRIATDTIILYCHGNKWHMDLYWQRAKLLANVGGKNRFGVMMVDYRGYGLSSGHSTEESLYADVNAALSWLKEKGLSEKRLVIYGYSLGSAPATYLTANPTIAVPYKLILEAPFASAAVMVQDGALLAMPASFFTSLKIDNAEQIKKVKQPFCWIHGTADDFLNIKTHGEVVFKNYKGASGEAHRIQGASHTNIPTIMGYSTYSQTLLTFITK